MMPEQHARQNVDAQLIGQPLSNQYDTFKWIELEP